MPARGAPGQRRSSGGVAGGAIAKHPAPAPAPAYSRPDSSTAATFLEQLRRASSRQPQIFEKFCEALRTAAAATQAAHEASDPEAEVGRAPLLRDRRCRPAAGRGGRGVGGEVRWAGGSLTRGARWGAWQERAADALLKRASEVLASRPSHYYAFLRFLPPSLLPRARKLLTDGARLSATASAGAAATHTLLSRRASACTATQYPPCGVRTRRLIGWRNRGRLQACPAAPRAAGGGRRMAKRRRRRRRRIKRRRPAAWGRWWRPSTAPRTRGW
jgi:hypothetical protein